MGRSEPGSLRPRLVLDTGALIALERDDRRVFEHLVTAARRGYVVVVPILVVMEAQRAARDRPRLDRILARIDEQLPLLPAMGRQVAALRRASGVESDADVVVVLEALAVPGSRILTGDARDIVAILDAAGAVGRVPVLRV